MRAHVPAAEVGRSGPACADPRARSRPERRRRGIDHDGSLRRRGLARRARTRRSRSSGPRSRASCRAWSVRSLILAVGWLVSRSVELAARRGLRLVGLDRAATRIGIDDWLTGTGIGMTLSEGIARLLFWLLMLTFLLSAVETLGLAVGDGDHRPPDRIHPEPDRRGPDLRARAAAGPLPRRRRRLAAAAAGVGGVAGSASWCRDARRGLVAVIAIQQLGIETSVLVAPLTALVAALGFTAGLAFALGARPSSRTSWPATSCASRCRATSSSRWGDVAASCSASARPTRCCATATSSWSIPNAQLLNQVVVR